MREIILILILILILAFVVSCISVKALNLSSVMRDA